MEKFLKLYVRIQTTLISFTWQKYWIGIQNSALLDSASLKVPQSSFFILFIINPFYPTNCRNFYVILWLLFKFIWIKHRNWMQKTEQPLSVLTNRTVILRVKKGNKTQCFLDRTRNLCAKTEKNYEFYPIRTVNLYVNCFSSTGFFELLLKFCFRNVHDQLY